jgi:hypothetical protein
MHILLNKSRHALFVFSNLFTIPSSGGLRTYVRCCECYHILSACQLQRQEVCSAGRPACITMRLRQDIFILYMICQSLLAAVNWNEESLMQQLRRRSPLHWPKIYLNHRSECQFDCNLNSIRANA